MKLLYYPNPLLLKKCSDVVDFDENLHSELEQMKTIMLENNGIGLSANQVGLDKNMFIMLSKDQVYEFINPIIIDQDGYANLREGCLSSPGIYETILTRPQQLTIVYKDKNGEENHAVLYDIEAVCASHEYDHLQGIFWFSKLPNRNARKTIEKYWNKNRNQLIK